MVFSSISFAFADTTTTTAAISKDAQACVTLGMLQGSDKGVTAEYLTTESTRLQAAIMVLRLRGLEKEALAYVGDKNFSDMTNYAWAEGKNMTAFLLAHPELAFIGDAGKFMPEQTINEKSYYKVMLETLGYKQTTPEVVGDFAWDKVFDFAKSIGLVPQQTMTFTNDDIARITIEALKTKNKSGVVLVNALVAAGTLSAEKVAASGIVVSAPVTIAVKTVKAIGNTVVEVEYTAAVDKAAVETLANYSVAGLEVKAAMLTGTKKVLLETAAQTAGKIYTLVVGDQKVNFGGAAKVTGAPELDKVIGSDTERVELTFDKVLDTVSALNAANYAIAGVTVVSGELNSARKVVTLTTEGMTAGKTYTIKVTNIKSVDGATLKSASKSFYSKSDKTAPKINSLEVMTNTRIKITFDGLVDNDTAIDMANYTIKAGTAELAIESLVAEDNDDDLTEVEITTASQKSGTRYELSVMNVADTSVLVNKITKAVKKTFTGKAEDKTLPTAGTPVVISRNIVKVTFTEASRLDQATATDVANYTFNNDVTVEKVEMVPGSTADGKTVLLTVSDLGEKSTYKLTIENISDEYGNVIKKVDKSVNYDKSKLSAATVSRIYSTSSNEVVVIFNKEVDPISAKDVANYTIDGNLGTPISSKINDELTKVTLKTNSQVDGKTYKVTIKGVKDLAGNVLNTSVKFVASATENDIELPEVEDVTAINNKILRVTFSEPIKVKGDEVTDTIKAVIQGQTGGPVTLDYKVAYEDNTVLEFSGTFNDNEYTLLSFNNTVKDIAGNKATVSPNYTFWGSDDSVENIEFSWEQVNVQKYTLTFTEKVSKPVAPASLAYNTKLEADDADDNGYDTVWHFTNKVSVDSKAFDDNINNLLVSPHGKTVLPIENLDSTTKTIIVANIDDEDGPYVANVYAKNRNMIKIEYNEDLGYKGGYSVYYYDNAGKKKTVSLGTADIDGDDANIVNLSTNTALESRYDYTLVVLSEAKDLNNNKSDQKDEEFTFAGTDLVPADTYITGVKIDNGQNFKVSFSAEVTDNTVVAKVYGTDENTPIATLAFPSFAADGKSVVFDLASANRALSEAITYKVVVGSMEYSFDGTVEEASVNYTYNTTNSNYDIAVSYSDVKTGDVIQYVAPNGTMTTGSASMTGKTLAVGDIFRIVVKSSSVDGVVLYYNEVKVEAQN